MHRKLWIFALLSLAATLRLTPAAAPKGVLIEVDAGAYDRQNTPVFYELPEDLRSQKARRGVIASLRQIRVRRRRRSRRKMMRNVLL